MDGPGTLPHPPPNTSPHEPIPTATCPPRPCQPSCTSYRFATSVRATNTAHVPIVLPHAYIARAFPQLHPFVCACLATSVVLPCAAQPAIPKSKNLRAVSCPPCLHLRESRADPLTDRLNCAETPHAPRRVDTCRATRAARHSHGRCGRPPPGAYGGQHGLQLRDHAAEGWSSVRLLVPAAAHELHPARPRLVGGGPLPVGSACAAPRHSHGQQDAEVRYTSNTSVRKPTPASSGWHQSAVSEKQPLQLCARCIHAARQDGAESTLRRPWELGSVMPHDRMKVPEWT